MRRSMMVLGMLVLAACGGTATPETPAAAPATDDPAAVRLAIEEANRQAVEAWMTRGDLAPMVANVEDGAVIMMSGMPTVRGKAAWESTLKELTAQMDIKDASFRTEDVIVSGDHAIETGRYAWSMGPKGGQMMPDSGKYLTVWHKQGDGSWKIVRDINNTDIAPKM